MKPKKNSLLIVLLFLFGANLCVWAQQESQYTQYMYNTIALNPAYAGSSQKLSVTTLYRTQWVGLDGAPTTINAAVDTPIGNGLGLAINFINDKIGPSDETDISANLSYYINISTKYSLFFGLRGSANLLNVDFTKLNIEYTQDSNFFENVDNRLTPNIGAGLYLQSDNSYLGISLPKILETTHYKHSQTSLASQKQHIYFIGGYVFNLSSNLKFKPATLVKVVSSSPTQVDLSANFLYNEKFTLGLGYRSSTAVSGLAAFQVSDKILIGYAYDQNTGNLGNYTGGSHEFFLKFDLFNYGKIDKLDSRFF